MYVFQGPVLCATHRMSYTLTHTLSCSSTHVQVTALAMGRLYAKLEADNSLGQLLLPLLADLLTSASSAVRSTTGSITAAAGAGAGAAGVADGAAAAAAAAQATPAEVAGAVVCALEGMASVCVQRGQDQWLYGQALQLLLRMYREPGPVSSQCSVGLPPALRLCTAACRQTTTHLDCLGASSWPTITL
jgi:hypothetical protein